MEVKIIKLWYRERLRSLKGVKKGYSERRGLDLRWRLLLLGIIDKDIRVVENMGIGVRRWGMLMEVIIDSIKFVKE